ncbi:lipopolysaccharide biosynthesis protein [Photobacterium minamisatsumaniensis]|uniref:lipopolysaccharide biosynthesis protein n=1 Tax=Photobacterium minamisatsumaniensis TaxID=2910233 RepID=UPI003D0AE5F8
MRSKSFKIASLSVCARGLKILSGPITLLVVSKQLSLEEISFYYTFFNLLAMQQLAELGIGHTLKQFVAHSYKVNKNGWRDESKQKIKDYILFGIKWFSFIALFILVFVGYGGELFYSTYRGDIDWKTPWWIIIISMAFFTLLTPLIYYLEGTQKQVVVYKAQLISSLINSFVIWISLYNNLGLLSISIGLILSNITLYFILICKEKKHISNLLLVKSITSTKEVFVELWPLLSKVSIVWGFGFIFWNGFNLISFQIFDPELAGKIIFSFTLAKAGFNVAESVIYSQMTIFGKKISDGDFKQAYEIFKRYRKISFIILISGYVAFVFVMYFIPNLFVFEKIVSISYLVQIFAFFTVLLYLTTNNNFIRCFKVEPFTKVSAYHSITVPLAFYISSLIYPQVSFILCTLALMISVVWASKISKRYLTGQVV